MHRPMPGTGPSAASTRERDHADPPGRGADEEVTMPGDATERDASTEDTGGADAIIVYWRPGCGFCSGLLRGLERQRLGFERVNIWEDPDGAAFVRSVTGGSETVPTVRVGRMALVNPGSRDVLRTVAQERPDRLPPDIVPDDLIGPDDLAPRGAEKLLNRLFGG